MLQTARCCRCVIFTLYVAIVFPDLEPSQLQTIVRDLDLITTLKQQLPVLITKCAHCDICNTDMCVGCLYYPILHENRSTHTEKSRQQEQIVSLLFDIRHTLCISTHMVHTSDKRFVWRHAKCIYNAVDSVQI